MPEKITLINEKGESNQSDVISVFKVNNKKFIITTNNEVDPNGLTVLNISEVNNDKLNSVTDDSDWDAIKNIMRSIISGTDKTKPEYEPILSIANINSTNSFRYISVSNSAISAMINDYSSNKPVGDTSGNEPIVNLNNVPSANAFNNLESDPQNSGLPVNYAIYPQQDINNSINQNTVPVANGINVVQQPLNQLNFEQANNLVNPLDLIGSKEVNNVVNSEVSSINSNNNMNMNLSSINPNASLEEIRKIAIDNITAIVTNYVDVIAQKEMETVNKLRLENERKHQELLAQEELIKSKLMEMQNPYSYQQPVIPNVPDMNMANGVIHGNPQMNVPPMQNGMNQIYPNQGMMNQGFVQNIPDMNVANGVIQGNPQMNISPMQNGMSQMYPNQGMMNQGVLPSIPDINMMNGVIPQDQQTS